MTRLPSYVKRDANKTYYIRFKFRHCTYEVRGFANAMLAMEHKITMESQLLNGVDFNHKIIKTPVS